MENLVWRIFIVLALLTTVISSTKSKGAQVYRFSGRDIFKNPEYSSYIECGVGTCTQFQAKCLEDGNCCLCRCNFKFSTYNVSEARCVSDETILSVIGSAFRFTRNDESQKNIPIMKTLSEPKTLGKIVAINGKSALKKCKVLMKASYYWSDRRRGDWKPLMQRSNDRLFNIRATKNDVTLQWVYTNSTRNSWFHGHVFRLSIQCTGITSTIIFKSRKNYNENDFIGCLNPDKETTPPTTTFNCSTMTPTMCKRFCQGHGHSVAMLKQGTQCFCSEYTQVMFWSETKFSCLIPCTGEEGKFCGGKETYSAYRTIPEWPHDFKFSSNGALDSSMYRCTEITQPNPSTSWNSTYLCAKKIGTNIKLRWFSEEPRENILAKRRCIAINQTSNSTYWKDNFLCVSKEVGLMFMRSYYGQIHRTECLKMETEVGFGWENNYLCAVRPNDKTEVSMPCPNRTGPPLNDPNMATLTPASMPHSQRTNRHTDSLPHSSEYLPFHSTISTSGSKQGSKMKDKDHDNNLTPLYIFLPLACILCILTVSIFVILYLKKKIKSKQCLNSQVRITNFDNPIWQMDMNILDGKIDQHATIDSRRKSRKERIPSLPALKSETYQLQTPNTILESLEVPSKTQITPPGTLNTPPNLQNATQAPITLAAIAEERSKTLRMESGVYAEIPMAPSNVRTFNEYQSGDQHNVDTNNRVYNRVNSLGNPTYESIDNFFNPECLYLEVLP